MIDEKIIKERLATELRTRMNAKNERVGDVSYHCEIDQGILYRCQDNGQFPNPWQLVMIAEHFDCSVNELLGFEPFDVSGKYEASRIFPGENHFAEYLSHRIIQYLNNHEMTIEELVRCVRSTTGTVNRWFQRWPALPRTIHLHRLADALNCTPSDLLGY